MKQTITFLASIAALTFLLPSCNKKSAAPTSNNSPANDTAYVVSTLAGSSGLAGSLALDPSGSLYVDMYGSNTVAKITLAGVVSTFAGSGQPGNGDAIGTAATFNEPYAISIDPSGNIYVAEWRNCDVRKITPSGVVSTLAGSPNFGYADATGAAAQFHFLSAIATDNTGNQYVFDFDNNRIRKVTPGGAVSTFVGSGTPGSADGTGQSAQLGAIYGMCADASGNIYMADNLYNTIRKITPAGVVTTIAGTPDDSGNFLDADGIGANASFAGPADVAADQYGNLYVVDWAVGGATVRKIFPSGKVITIAGVPGTQGGADGPGHQATFQDPGAIVVASNGVIYVADAGNNNIRVLTPQQ